MLTVISRANVLLLLPLLVYIDLCFVAGQQWLTSVCISCCYRFLGILQGREVAHVLESNGVIHFPDPYTVGFGWDSDGSLLYPFKPKQQQSEGPLSGLSSSNLGAQPAAAGGKDAALVGAASKTWFAGTDKDAPRNADGSFAYNWHWNSPYRVKRDVPDLFRKEVQRYVQ
jgi:cell division protease FtsH